MTSNAFIIDDIRKKIIIYFKIEFPPEKSTKAFVTLLPLATDDNSQFEGNVKN